VNIFVNQILQQTKVLLFISFTTTSIPFSW